MNQVEVTAKLAEATGQKIRPQFNIHDVTDDQALDILQSIPAQWQARRARYQPVLEWIDGSSDDFEITLFLSNTSHRVPNEALEPTRGEELLMKLGLKS